MTATPSQLFLETLADHNRLPAALRFRLTAKASKALTALLSSNALTTLAAKTPCLLVRADAEGLPVELLVAFENAGGQVIAADAIQTQSIAEWAADAPLTATYLAGDWYLSPPAKPSHTQTASRALALKLLQLVAADAETRELEEIFRHDPSMSYQLLRLVNSLYRGNRQITSFAQAIVILGRSQLRRWINLMLFTPRKEDARLPMLMLRVLVRARTMELLAHAAGYDKATQESAFMAGMFSLLGVLFGTPLTELLQPLNLSTELRAAVLSSEGRLGQLLATVSAYEARDDQALSAHLAALPAPTLNFDTLQIEAQSWTLELVGDDAEAPGAEGR